MEFEHIGYEIGTGKSSSAIETYNFHKAAAVLAEYGFECVRLTDDWEGADFVAYHKTASRALSVQLKTCLVIDKRYMPFKELYMCFPLDGTDGTWYLVKHADLVAIVEEYAPDWFYKYRMEGGFFHYTGRYGRTRATQRLVLDALERFAYRPLYRDLGYREARDFKLRKSLEYAKVEKTEIRS